MNIDVQEAIGNLYDKLQGWTEGFFALLPNLVVALLVLFLFWLLSKMVRRMAARAMARITDNRALHTLVKNVAGIAMLGVGLFIALGVLKLDKTVAALLGGAGVVALALGFAFQDIAENFMAGILMALRRPFSVGDTVETGDFFGRVEEVNLRNTILRLPTGQVVLIPNSDVFGDPITNYTRGGERRVDLECGVSYGDDLEQAEEVAQEAVASVSLRNRDRDPELFYTEFGGSSINFVVRFWIDDFRQSAFLAARSEAIQRIHRAFDDAGLDIPFPITTLDFGIKGGEPLSKMLGSPES
ncbi:MAG: mechanosensitive ion channel family protein [Thermoanaerobaculia bacterium]|nr:mechanosensitive ion channel family protein [Thermoanaerobaculia bacterium]